MAALDPVPMPPELAEPEPGANRWLQRTVDYAVVQAYRANLDPDAMGAELAQAAAAGEADDEAELPEPARRWTITDDGAAEWAMRHVAVADEELLRLRAQADEWAQRIQQWYVRASEAPLATKGFMEAHLERYALERRAADPKAKTLHLPAGRVQTTYRQARVEVADPDAVVAWAEAAGYAAVLRVKKEPRVSALREYAVVATTDAGLVAVDADGVVVPGTYVAPEQATATVKADRP